MFTEAERRWSDFYNSKSNNFNGVIIGLENSINTLMVCIKSVSD